MGCLKVLFGLTLVLRTAFHGLVAVYAAKDLYDLHDATSGTLKQLALKVTHMNEVVKEFEIPLVFYVLCGVMLFILTCIYPWRDSHRYRLSAYVILHVLYVAMVVYIVYVRTIVDLSYLRDIYQEMTIPWLFPASLVLDVLTIICGCVSTGKTPGQAFSRIVPLYRERVIHDDHNPLVIVTA